MIDARDALRRELHENSGQSERKQQPERCARGAQNHCLRQQLSRDSGCARTQCAAHGQLLPALHSVPEQKQGDVGACNEQQHDRRAAQ